VTKKYKSSMSDREYEEKIMSGDHDVDKTQMTFKEYEELARETSTYHQSVEEITDGSIKAKRVMNLSYATLGLTAEAGEVANDVKKIIRDDGGLLFDGRQDDLVKELGDVLWYVAAVARELGVSLEEVARLNNDKLKSRYNIEE
jgi:NTP pyrophosphatase (non-canonical NTP hydrolase)